MGDYVLWRLTGELCTSYSVASWTGLLNRHTLQWDDAWLYAIADHGRPTVATGGRDAASGAFVPGMA